MSFTRLALAAPVVTALAFAMAHGLHAPASSGPDAAPAVDPAPRVQTARLPIAFERNQGQTDAAVQYFARGPGYSLFLTPTEAVFSLREVPKPAKTGPRDRAAPSASDRTAVVRMALAGANAKATVEGLAPQTGTSHYFRGTDSQAWQGDVAQFGKVRYRGVYDGIDVVYYGNQSELEYDFVIAPGKDPAQVAIDFDGQTATRVDAQGNLVLATELGDLVQRRPFAYQIIDGQRVPVEAGYRRVGDLVAFELGHYDRSRELVIDPVLGYSSYLGGSADDYATAMDVDAAGNTYLAGYTASLDFPRQGSTKTLAGPSDAFVAKLNAAGNALVYSVYLGGAGNDQAFGLDLDAQGNAYVVGATWSSDFPTVTPLQATLKGTVNGFVAKLSPTGALVYSTYLGAQQDEARDVVVDSLGNAYVVGSSNGGMTLPGAAHHGAADGYLVKLGPAGNTMPWGTHLGGTENDALLSVDLGSDGSVFVAGYAISADFQTFRQHEEITYANAGGAGFAAHFTSAGEYLLGTRLGGMGMARVVLALGTDMLVAGDTWTGDPIDGPPDAPALLRYPVQHGAHGQYDGHFVLMSGTGQLYQSSLLGGFEDDLIFAAARGPDGGLYLAGSTRSPDFLTLSPFQRGFGGVEDGFIVKVNKDQTRLEWSSFLGGAQRDVVYGMHVDATSRVRVVGRTYSPFPTAGVPLRGTPAGGRDAYVAAISGPTVTSARYTQGDITDDGCADIVWAGVWAGEGSLWLSSDSLIPHYRLPASQAVGWSQTDGLLHGDFNGDHQGDILFVHGTDVRIYWSGSLNSASRTLGSSAWRAVGIGDFNKDGKSDVMWRNFTTGANDVWLSGDPATRRPINAVPSLDWIVAGVGDITGDGIADVLWRNTRTGVNELWPSAYPPARITLTPVADMRWKVAALADFTGDGRADVVWHNSVTGANELWPNAYPPARITLYTVTNTAWDIVGAGDYDGDGKADLLWHNTSGQNVVWRAAQVGNQMKVATTAVGWMPVR